MAITPPATLARPFAESGDKASIPDTTATAGAASLTEGFPPVTQLPLSAGGIPPRRLDFNGILNQLSQFAFWAQSGGQFRWSSALDYASPCMVFGSDGKIYFGLAPSGPGVSGVGAKNPVTVANQGTYWVGLTGYALEPATKTKLGGIIVGDGFTITAAGVLSVDPNSFSSDIIVELMKQLHLPQWLTANKSWYVRPDGNDNNDGSANTAAGAFKTIQAAINYVTTNFNATSYAATIRVAAGLYSERITLPDYQASTGSFSLVGEDKNTTIIVGALSTIQGAKRWSVSQFTLNNDGNPGPGSNSNAYQVFQRANSILSLDNIKINFTTLGSITSGVVPISVGSGGSLGLSFVDIVVSSALTCGRLFTSSGGRITMTNNCDLQAALSGSSPGTLTLDQLAVFDRSYDTTTGGSTSNRAIFTGNVTGRRYYISQNSICDTHGGGDSFIPGTVAGSATTGAQYT